MLTEVNLALETREDHKPVVAVIRPPFTTSKRGPRPWFNRAALKLPHIKEALFEA